MTTPADAVTADALEYDVHIAATPETVWRFWTDRLHTLKDAAEAAQREIDDDHPRRRHDR